MRLRLYRAPGMAAAMAMVRAELGNEAVILESRRVAGGVEVTAAVEPAEPILIPPLAPLPLPARVPPPADPLAWHNLPAALARRLAGNNLTARLAAAIAFAPLPDPGGPPLLLAGPPGAGKTLTCAKLATRAVLAGASPLVVTTDGERAGAMEQLAAFTQVLGLTLVVAPGPGVLAKALAGRAPGQPVLIDTAGCDPFDPAQAAALLRLVRVAGGATLAVLPAGLDAGEAGDLARAFAALGARHLLPTRLDGARRLGGVLAAAEAGLALTEAGTAPGAAGGLTRLTPEWLAQRLLQGRPQETRA